MTPDRADPPVQRWTRTRWLTAIVLVIGLHVALIWMFGRRRPEPPEQFPQAPSLTLAANSNNEWLALNDATLFALPDRNGFAGPMWETIPPFPIHPPELTEDLRWLEITNSLGVAELGSDFDALAHTDRIASIHFNFNQPPPLVVPESAKLFDVQMSSTLQIKGAIANRRLLTPMKLPSWPYSDVIAPSVVQVLVNAAGDVLSAVLLSPDSYGQPAAYRDPDADHRAVELARAARFEPLAPLDAALPSSPAKGLILGQLIFNWQTVPVTTTNAPK